MNERVGIRTRPWLVLICTSVLLTATWAASAEEDTPFALDPAKAAANSTPPANLLLAQAPAEQAPLAKPQENKAIEETKSALPISFGLTYGLYSDYFWRGINWSEYEGEHSERLNHQLTVSLSLDLGDFGELGYSTWFEWYAGQQALNPEYGGGQNCQEIDYTLWYSYSFEQIKTDVTLSLIFYEYLNLARALRADDEPGNDNDDRSQEISLEFAHNDAWLWKWLFPNNEEGILNPTFMVAQDVGSVTGTWMEWGISHPFAIPGIDNLTITPGYTLAAQCNYWMPGFFLAGDTWSLVTTYDLTPVLNLPSWAGTITVSGELYYWNAYNHMGDSGLSKDLLWGGMSVNWAWGG